MQRQCPIFYFDTEGKENLVQVIRIIKKFLKKRPEMQSLKIVILTGFGEGPALAYNMLQENDPEIVAVTFPPTFFVKTKNGEFVNPRIPPKLRAFFDGVKIKVIAGRLPFDRIEGVSQHNDQMNLIRDTLSVFGGGFPLLIQAVLQSCDMGIIEPGERVIAMTGDSAAVITASTTLKFLSREGGLEVNEILCKPRAFDRSRVKVIKSAQEQTGNLFEVGKKDSQVEFEGRFLPDPEEN